MLRKVFVTSIAATVAMALIGCLMFQPVSATAANLTALIDFEGSADDRVGANHGTLHDGASIVTDAQRDQVLGLDGYDDYVSFSQNMITTTEFTVAAWAKQLGLGGGSRSGNTVFCQRNDNTGDNNVGVHLTAECSVYRDSAVAAVRSTNGSVDVVRSPKLGYDAWHHYAFTVTTTDIVFYINGVEVDREPNTQLGNFTDGVDYVDIGRERYKGIDKQFFNGMIDDFRVYDGALSGDEVMALVPEPTMLVLLGLGSLGLRRRR